MARIAAPSSLLDQIRADFAARGWDPADADRFRMDATAAATIPTIPEDLSSLSDEEIVALLQAVADYAEAARDGADISDETLANLEALADGADRLRGEQTAREEAAAEAQRRLEEATARLLPPRAAEPAEGDEPAAPAAPAAEATPEPAPLAAAATATPARRPAPATPAVAPLSATPPAASGRRREVLVPEVLQPLRPRATITAAADVPGTPVGSELNDFSAVADALIRRRESIGQPMIAEGVPGEKVIVASIHANLPEERVLRNGADAENARKIAAVTAPEAIVAAGGLCAPLQPYYDLLVLAGAQRPLRDALPTFQADRGGIRFIPPPRISNIAPSARTVADGATTNASPTVTSATAAFDARDVGAAISGAGIPAGAYIISVTNATTVTISANATATAAGVSITITRQGATGLITVTQDAAALNGTQAQIVAATKPVLHVTCPGPTDVQIYAITRQLEFGNFTARAFPEQVEAWTRLAIAYQARRAEQALLDTLAANSTAFTAAGVVGAARELVAQIVKAAAYYRNVNRMPADAPLRWAGPAWTIDLMIADLVRGSGYEVEFFAMARQEIVNALQDVNVRATFYIDSGTGKGQLFGNGVPATAGTLMSFPTTCVWYLFSEGSWLLLDGGTLDLGLVRDSSLNNLNNYRVFAETFEALAFVGVESMEVTSTVKADGTYAGTAYGSSTVGAPVAIPAVAAL